MMLPRKEEGEVRGLEVGKYGTIIQAISRPRESSLLALPHTHLPLGA